MSIQAMAAVLEDIGNDVRGTARLVLLSLANHANDRGECWPSIETIARESAAHYDTAKSAIRWLVDEGWIERDKNAAPDERIPTDRRPNLYRLGTWWQRPGRLTPPAAGANHPERPGRITPNGGGESPRQTIIEPSGNRGSPIDKDTRFSPGAGKIEEWQGQGEVAEDQKSVNLSGVENARRRAHPLDSIDEEDTGT